MEQITNKLRYDQVVEGDTLFIKTDANKKGEEQKVIAIKNWQSKGGHVYSLTFENGDVWLGYANRFLKQV